MKPQFNTINTNEWYGQVVTDLINNAKASGIEKITIYIGLCETYATLPYTQPATGNVHWQNYSLHKDLRAVKQICEAGLQVEFEGIIDGLNELGIDTHSEPVKKSRVARRIVLRKKSTIEMKYITKSFIQRYYIKIDGGNWIRVCVQVYRKIWYNLNTEFIRFGFSVRRPS